MSNNLQEMVNHEAVVNYHWNEKDIDSHYENKWDITRPIQLPKVPFEKLIQICHDPTGKIAQCYNVRDPVHTNMIIYSFDDVINV